MSPERKPKRPLAPLPDGLPPEVAALANEMRRGRDEVDLSLSELAQRMFSSKASVSRWLGGAALPTRDQAQRWAEVCGTDKGRMSNCWDALANGERQGLEPPGCGDGDGDVPARRSGRRLMIFLGAVVAVSTVAFLAVVASHRGQRCPTPHVVLQVPSISGSSMGITMHMRCAISNDRTYLLIEEVPDVDPRNPHSVYFVKAYLVRPDRGSTESHQLLLEEPVGTRAKFYVISVDESGSHAIEQNRVVDEGIIELPRGTRLESDVIWHVKKWQDS